MCTDFIGISKPGALASSVAVFSCLWDEIYALRSVHDSPLNKLTIHVNI